MTGIDWQRVTREAKRRFGITEFRPGQQALIEAVLSNRDVLGIMPTGAGKSLAYQLPSLLLPNATVVVSPLIALMQDQQEKTAEAKVSVVKIDSTLSASEARAAIEEIAEGEARVIFVTPERLEDPEYVTLLKQRGVSRLVVDEAHCVSQWGHDFRPAYLALRDAIKRLGHPPVLALTATAPPHVATDVLQQLGIEDAHVINTGADRENLALEVRRTATDSLKREALLDILGPKPDSTIVYVATVRAAIELWQWLRERGFAAACYHGELSTGEREDAQSGFMADRYRVVVATKAFGLGIDKADIRTVVHYHFPDSPETYYQEAGRAGRDGKPAHAILLYRLEDRRIQSYFLGGKYPRREDAQKLYEALHAASREANGKGVTLRELTERANLGERRTKVLVAQLEKIGILDRRQRRLHQRRAFTDAKEFERFLREYEQRQTSERQRLDAIMHYAQSTLCRMRYLRNYLGDATDIDCHHCDNCRSGATKRQRIPVRRRARIGAPPAIATNKGQRVWHARFGEGEVLDGGGGHFTVNFPRAGVKRVLGSYLKWGKRQ